MSWIHSDMSFRPVGLEHRVTCQSQVQSGFDSWNFPRLSAVVMRCRFTGLYRGYLNLPETWVAFPRSAQNRGFCVGIKTAVTGFIRITLQRAWDVLTLVNSCKLNMSPVSTPSPRRSCCGTCGRHSPLCWTLPTPSVKNIQQIKVIVRPNHSKYEGWVKVYLVWVQVCFSAIYWDIAGFIIMIMFNIVRWLCLLYTN